MPEAERRLRVAVVGVGHLGSIHARILAASQAAELRCVVDADLERAGALAGELGCEAAQDASRLGPETVDAVVVGAVAGLVVAIVERQAQVGSKVQFGVEQARRFGQKLRIRGTCPQGA